jgi:HEAT repeat protein
LLSSDIAGMAASELAILRWLGCDELSVKQRRALLSKLIAAGTERSVPALRVHLRSPDLQCQVRAVFALAHVGSDAAIAALVECLAMETGPRFTFAVRELGRRGGGLATRDLVMTLEGRAHELNNGDKRVIIAALSRAPHRSEVPVLARMLRERNGRTRRAAATVLEEIRAPESRAALLEARNSLSWLRGLPARRALARLENRNE